MRICQSLPLCQTNECSVCLNGQPFISKKKTNVYQGQRCFIFSPERTRPCRMLNNFHLCSCLPRLIVVLSPSTVETTPSSSSAPCPCAHSFCDLIWKWLYADAYIAPCQRLYKQTNTEGEKAKLEAIWIEGQTNA